jgi:hypothetical protein
MDPTVSSAGNLCGEASPTREGDTASGTDCNAATHSESPEAVALSQIPSTVKEIASASLALGLASRLGLVIAALTESRVVSSVLPMVRSKPRLPPPLLDDGDGMYTDVSAMVTVSDPSPP